MRPVLLAILDGLGLREPAEDNAFSLAHTPVLDGLMKDGHGALEASGSAVGLTPGQMGNSEVGHLTIGSGRVLDQDLVRLNKIAQGDQFLENPVLRDLAEYAKKRGRLHIMGLVSDGGVHSHMEQMKGLMRMAKEAGVEEVSLHAFTDGRDTAPNSGLEFVGEMDDYARSLGVGRVDTIIGRYYAMDRDQRWERVERAYDLLVRGKGAPFTHVREVFRRSYEEEITDEFLLPHRREGARPIEKGDAVIFANFRSDRAKQLSRALLSQDFPPVFPLEELDLAFVSLTEYDPEFTRARVAYPKVLVGETLGQVISEAGLRQLRIAETEKYPHVTYFFDGGISLSLPGKEEILIPSPKVATYDEMPQMSAPLVAEKLVEILREDPPDFTVLNFANCDMVGHTGVIPAAVEAVETVDRCLGQVLEALREKDGIAIITADHGNCEEMTRDGAPLTAHTTNLVPALSMGYNKKLRSGSLSDLAPTILECLSIEPPAAMTGRSLWVEEES
ncbi:MAG: 2,3-bisphosphoglycerate-independent phosphoglycerate mutase [Tissierellia bacterium]|nr:2,3-bisphosphoglycerate-independent phosphoglycerate mutase [Tissierellia bacterium]